MKRCKNVENVNRKEWNRALEAVIDLPWGAGTKGSRRFKKVHFF